MLFVDGVEFEGIWLSCKVCGKRFEVRPYHKDRRKFCGDPECVKNDIANSMREYRKTEKGKAAVIKDNERHKRPEVEIKCEVCHEVFKTARKSRYICSKTECQESAVYIRIKKYRSRLKTLYKTRKGELSYG